jgi:hypothetical protein
MRMGSLADDTDKNYCEIENCEPSGTSNMEVNMRHKEIIATKSL